MDSKNIIESVWVPETLLKSKELLPSAKLVWISLLIHSRIQPGTNATKTRLAEMTGLVRTTIYKALQALRETGWYKDGPRPVVAHRANKAARVYLDLFFNTTLSISSRLFHGLIQLTEAFGEKNKQFRYSSIAQELGMNTRTVKRATRALTTAGWMHASQAHMHAFVEFSIHNPVKEALDVLLAKIIKDIDYAKNKGEALAKGILSFISPSKDFIDNARPGYMSNPDTDGLLEFDRFYLSGVAMEFNGNQHYEATDKYGIDKVLVQQRNDAHKRQICMERNIVLLNISARDLSVGAISRMVKPYLPLRNLWSAVDGMALLDMYCDAYRDKTPRLKSH